VPCIAQHCKCDIIGNETTLEKAIDKTGNALLVMSFNNELPLWDKQNALQRLGGNQQLLSKIVAMFLEQISPKYLALTNALSNENADEVAFVSHAIKGIAGDIGALALRHKASEIEHMARQNQLSQLTFITLELDKTINETVQVLRADLT